MIPSRTPSRLKELTLFNVMGLSEDDMLTFLTYVAPTLQILTLDDCTFTNGNNSSEAPLSCYFVDRVMPLCISLRELTILSGPGVQIHTVASLHLKPTCIEGSRIHSNAVWDYKKIVDVLAGLKWEVVELKTNRGGPYVEAERMAAARGIKLHLCT
jgi:hypothetical protein